MGEHLQDYNCFCETVSRHYSNCLQMFENKERKKYMLLYTLLSLAIVGATTDF